MKKVKISITKKDLEDCSSAFEEIAEYPLYASTCGISRAEGILIARIMELRLENEDLVDVEVTFKGKIKIDYGKSPSNH